MKALSIARKTLLELWREPLLLGLMLLFPTVIVGFYYIAFGQTKDGLSSYLSVLVVNDDAGAAMARESSFDVALQSIPLGQDRPFGAALQSIPLGQDRPFDIAHGRPFDIAHGRPFDIAHGRPFDVAQEIQWQAGAALIEVLRGIKWEGEPVFEVEVVDDRRAAEIALQEHKASLLLVIPPDFTQTLMDASAGGSVVSPAVFSVVGNPG